MTTVKQMSKYKLIIFDFDGTLADTSEGIFNSIRYSSSKLSLPTISYEQMCSFVGPALSHSYSANFGLSGEKLANAIKYHKEYGVGNGYKELKFYDGIFDLLDTLKRNCIKTAVATLKPQMTLDKIINEYDCHKYFDMCKGADENNPMTKAEMIQWCIEKSGISASDALLIGDSGFDAEGAQKAGVGFIAVTYGFGFGRDEEISYPCKSICNTVEEIKKIVFEM